uniref:DUF4304 domain-containing protein n=1 Tax=Prosthecobacter sp. TaxID=1965333 RepID=UPI003783FF13
MHESKKQISAALSPLLKEHGYKKRALTWHRLCPDAVLTFHVEKNRWGADQYSCHMGIYIRQMGIETSPPHFRCQIRTQLDRIVTDVETIDEALNFEGISLEQSVRISRIVEAVNTHALPWLEQHSTLTALVNLTRCDYDKLLPRILIYRAAYDHLRQIAEIH